MKLITRYFLLSCLFLSGVTTLKAQMTDGRPRFGIKLGVNGANLYDDAKAQDQKSRIGFTGGGFVQIPLGSHRLSLRPELLFATKGATYNFTNLTHSEVKFSYVELPLSLEYHLFSFLNLHAGLHAAWLADANGKIQSLSVNFIKDNFEQFDYGWHIGGGFDLGNLGLHLRLSKGLHQVGKQSVSSVIGSLKNAAWSITASYGF